MNSFEYVNQKIAEMVKSGMPKPDIIQETAELCIGWSYVYGGYGQKCTAANRESYAKRSTCPAAESAVIYSKCQKLRSSNPKSTCEGCKWYPKAVTLFFDCRGFTRWLLQQVGIQLKGAGATSQWNTNSNWTEKGDIKDLPTDKVCCLFMRGSDGKTMSHTGMHIGGGQIIHCSGEVKHDTTANKHWTHYAIPVGLDGTVPIPDERPTLRKGSTGVYVVECQNDLLQLGYDLSPYGADGKFGSKTETAVKAFQRDHNLVADGVVGSRTWQALDDAITPTPTPTKLYTVHIPHLTEYKADALIAAYSGSWKTEE